MKKTIIGIAVLIFVSGVLVWFARPDKNNSGGDNIASVSADEGGALVVEGINNYDFGEISMANGKVNHQFKIKNTGAAKIVVEKMYTSCMCTVAALIKGDKRFGPYGMPGHGFVPKINEEINPSEEAVVEIVFDPTAHGPAGVGRIQREIIIENSAGQPIKLQFVAVVTP